MWTWAVGNFLRICSIMSSNSSKSIWPSLLISQRSTKSNRWLTCKFHTQVNHYLQLASYPDLSWGEIERDNERVTFSQILTHQVGLDSRCIPDGVNRAQRSPFDSQTEQNGGEMKRGSENLKIWTTTHTEKWVIVLIMGRENKLTENRLPRHVYGIG